MGAILPSCDNFFTVVIFRKNTSKWTYVYNQPCKNCDCGFIDQTGRKYCDRIYKELVNFKI